ncbi:MAG: HD domain-containing protein [Defluviitaleaceae bacterium]|nr:HD domain-containing protein [Defluviitaleaceae bacterium]
MKIFRDPIHNVIDLDTGDEAVNELIVSLIDSKEFQRLRFIRQLGFAYFAYPSATHTRFEHALGVAFLAKRFTEKIISMEKDVLNLFCGHSDEVKLTEFFVQIRRDKALTIIAALLHDIGHGPLSHTFEELVPSKSHEEWTRAIILGDTEINRRLTGYDSSYPQAICNILSDHKRICTSAKIIAGQLDIDKMDYMLRDSYMTGAGYGNFDIEWLFNVLRVGVVDEQVEIGLDLGKGLSVAEDFVMARIYMFRNIYLHKTSIIAQKMLELLLERVRELPAHAAEKLFPNDSLKALLLDSDVPMSQLLDDYIAVSDIDMFAFLKLLQCSDDEAVASLAAGLLERRLFKRVDEYELSLVKQRVLDTKGRDMLKYYITELGPDTTLTYRADKDYILLFDKSGQGVPLHEKSVIIPSFVRENLPSGYYVCRRELKGFC